jgi:transcriptional regulator with XRE-family HTH domain
MYYMNKEFRKLFALIKLRGLSVRQVSKDTGISEPTLYSMSSNTSANPSYKVLRTLADYFGVGIDDISESSGMNKKSSEVTETTEKKETPSA